LDEWHLYDDEVEDTQESQSRASPQTQVVECFANIFCCFFSWSDTWDESASFLNIVCHSLWIEDDHRIKKGEDNDQDEIDGHRPSTWLLTINIEIDLYPTCYRTDDI